MTENDIWRIAIDWIRFHAAKKNSQEQFDTAWADSEAISLVLDDRFEELWKLILVIYSLDQSDRVQGMLSAGPIEDLLGQNGENFIDRVEDLAKRDPDFAKVLGGVWRNGISENVWVRLQAVWDRSAWESTSK